MYKIKASSQFDMRMLVLTFAIGLVPFGYEHSPDKYHP